MILYYRIHIIILCISIHPWHNTGFIIIANDWLLIISFIIIIHTVPYIWNVYILNNNIYMHNLIIIPYKVNTYCIIDSVFLYSTWSSDQSRMLTHPEITEKVKTCTIGIKWLYTPTPPQKQGETWILPCAFHSTHNPCTFELALGRIHHNIILQCFRGSYPVHSMMSHGHVCVCVQCMGMNRVEN